MCVEFMLGKIVCSHNTDAATTNRIMKKSHGCWIWQESTTKAMITQLINGRDRYDIRRRDVFLYRMYRILENCLLSKS